MTAKLYLRVPLMSFSQDMTHETMTVDKKPARQVSESSITPSQTKGSVSKKTAKNQPPKEIGGPKGLEPTRYGDWEAKGRCYDF